MHCSRTAPGWGEQTPAFLQQQREATGAAGPKSPPPWVGPAFLPKSILNLRPAPRATPCTVLGNAQRAAAGRPAPLHSTLLRPSPTAPRAHAAPRPPGARHARSRSGRPGRAPRVLRQSAAERLCSPSMCSCRAATPGRPRSALSHQKTPAARLRLDPSMLPVLPFHPMRAPSPRLDPLPRPQQPRERTRAPRVPEPG